MSDSARAAVMTQAGAELEMRRYPLPSVAPGSILVRVTCCTICGSDVHTWLGHRSSPTPIILGHEIVGEIVALGAGRDRDMEQGPLHPGDRITWTLCDSCGECMYCRELGLPMKCRFLQKYGHGACDAPPHFQGGFGEYCYLSPGTDVIKVPDLLSDEVVAPANCALATVVAGWESVGLQPGENVLVLGAGALGVYASALARDAGCRQVLVIDVLDRRLEFVRAFGATATLNSKGSTTEEIVAWVHGHTGGVGVDAAMEVAGVAGVIPASLKCLRIGGRIVLHGTVVPGADFTFDASEIVFRLLTVKGVHNYQPLHLKAAVAFLARTHGTFPFEKIVTDRVSLEQASHGLHLAAEGRGLRVAVHPALAG